VQSLRPLFPQGPHIGRTPSHFREGSVHLVSFANRQFHLLYSFVSGSGGTQLKSLELSSPMSWSSAIQLPDPSQYPFLKIWRICPRPALQGFAAGLAQLVATGQRSGGQSGSCWRVGLGRRMTGRRVICSGCCLCMTALAVHTLAFLNSFGLVGGDSLEPGFWDAVQCAVTHSCIHTAHTE
jgi:hypothetical protein